MFAFIGVSVLFVVALTLITAFTLPVVYIVGEWQGDTGTKGFEKLLSAEFSCEELLTLPNWGDTCYMLTVWRRRKSTSGGEKGNKDKEGKKKEAGGVKTSTSGNGSSSGGVAEHLLPHKTHPFLCSHCGCGRTDSASGNNDSGSSGKSEVRQLSRCRLTYNVHFCSSACATLGRAAHLDELAVKCLLQGTETAQEPVSLKQPLLELSANYFVKVAAPVKL